MKPQPKPKQRRPIISISTLTAPAFKDDPNKYETAPTFMLAFRPRLAVTLDAIKLEAIPAKKNELVKKANNWLSNEQYILVDDDDADCSWSCNCW